MSDYTITEDRSDKHKFRCMVSFNGRDPEYYEVDSLDGVEVDAVLSKVAADLEVSLEEPKSTFEIVAGKVISKATVEEVIE